MALVKQTGELDLIARLVRQLPRAPGSGVAVAVGVGDDCAVVRPDPRSRHDWLLTSDPVIEGVHFTPDTPPALVGRKAVGRVLSDLAAMGGEPLWALIDLVAPPATPVRRLEAVYRGVAAQARAAGLAIVGGDTSSGPALELHVFAAGRVPRGRALLRSGARPGDRLYVTGTLGGSLAGKHLRFTPRLAEGRWLREGRWARAMMDVSDGLATDLRRLAQASGTGAELDAAAIPCSAAARAARDGRTALDHALADGEDFELLFAVPAARAAAFERAWRRAFRLRCTCVGRMTAQRGALALRQPDGTCAPLALRGFEHFRGRAP